MAQLDMDVVDLLQHGQHGGDQSGQPSGRSSTAQTIAPLRLATVSGQPKNQKSPGRRITALRVSISAIDRYRPRNRSSG
ncbi:hypothetical protein CGZ94_20995 [Enemella evansiae]|uniref:Uncharacterized protein n=1 Tax=Enemella evansiae TaxID=2016499 RepID=A0A255FW93_9ACTN|nr:hypothetical protein CGZ94_20995 [Enemella evansiae]